MKSGDRRKRPTKAAIVRAVASSTAIDACKPVRAIEQRLREAARGRFRDLKLAR